MRPVVLIPYRKGDRFRERNFRYVTEWWEQFGWPIHVASGPSGGLMNRSAARNEAAAKAGDWTVGVFADADTVGEPDAVKAAVVKAVSGCLAYPFDRYEAYNDDQTLKLMAGEDPGRGRTVKYPSPGGILAVSRKLFDQVGGYDEAFVGWGYEDLAFAMAARTLGGSHRQEATILHLWHPTAPEKRAHIHWKGGNRRRRVRYGEADGDPAAMRALLAEL